MLCRVLNAYKNKKKLDITQRLTGHIQKMIDFLLIEWKSYSLKRIAILCGFYPDPEPNFEKKTVSGSGTPRKKNPIPDLTFKKTGSEFGFDLWKLTRIMIQIWILPYFDLMEFTFTWLGSGSDNILRIGSEFDII